MFNCLWSGELAIWISLQAEKNTCMWRGRLRLEVLGVNDYQSYPASIYILQFSWIHAWETCYVQAKVAMQTRSLYTKDFAWDQEVDLVLEDIGLVWKWSEMRLRGRLCQEIRREFAWKKEKRRTPPGMQNNEASSRYMRVGRTSRLDMFNCKGGYPSWPVNCLIAWWRRLP